MATLIDLEDDFGITFELAEINLSDITDTDAGGVGSFDIFMQAVSSHLAVQHKSQRITGNDYATVYINAMQLALQSGAEFILSKCKTQAEINLINAQTAKALWEVKQGEIQYLIAQAMLERTRAEVELMQQRVITEQAQTDGAVIGPESMLDRQAKLIEKQTEAFDRKNEQAAASLIWDIYKVKLSVGEETNDNKAGSSYASMRNALTVLFEGAGMTVAEEVPETP